MHLIIWQNKCNLFFLRILRRITINITAVEEGSSEKPLPFPKRERK
jgi:hypothetical protein